MWKDWKKVNANLVSTLSKTFKSLILNYQVIIQHHNPSFSYDDTQKWGLLFLQDLFAELSILGVLLCFFPPDRPRASPMILVGARQGMIPYNTLKYLRQALPILTLAPSSRWSIWSSASSLNAGSLTPVMLFIRLCGPKTRGLGCFHSLSLNMEGWSYVLSYTDPSNRAYVVSI